MKPNKDKLLGNRIKDFILDIFFPKLCFGCQREGAYLCQDCQSVLEISNSSYCLCQKPQRLPLPGKCQKCQNKNLEGLYFAVPYQNNLIKKLIHSFKYEPFVKEISEDLASAILSHLRLIEKQEKDFKEFLLTPMPLHHKKTKWRGFNQSYEIAKHLGRWLNIPIIQPIIRTKETISQVELEEQERKENLKGAFKIENSEPIFNRKILLIDDVYTTGSTMEEAARILKKAGAKEIWGIVAARG